MSTEQETIEGPYPLNQYFIVQNEDGRYDLCERDSENSMSGQRVDVLSGEWVVDRKMRVIRPWRSEDECDMTLLQRLAVGMRKLLHN